MNNQLQNFEVTAKRSWGVILAWIGGITAVIGFIGTIGGGFAWFRNHHRQSSEYTARIALAQTETKQKQYRAALGTYREILKENPLDRSALDGQLDAAMLWTENFSIMVPEGKDEGDISGPPLDDIFSVLDSGLTRVQGTRSADVQAHLGWAHFLNHKISHREDDSVALENWREALKTEPNNVYAHAMLGNWLLQSGGNLSEAIGHFRIATATDRALPFVRTLQLGGLLHLEVTGARAETMKVVNQMRKAGEPLESSQRNRILTWCFDPVVTNHAELVEALGALPVDDAWKTYLWLSGNPGQESPDPDNLNQQFIHANLLELNGSRDAALTEFRSLQKKLQGHPGSLLDQVDAEIKNLNRT